jgi:nucleoside-diphosphate-sugar epimerase
MLIMARVLVTGSMGFTGRYLTARLLKDGHEVHGLAHRADENAFSRLEAVHVANLNDYAALSRIVGALRPQWVVHLAAIAFVAHGDVDSIYNTNIVGTRNLLQALVDVGISVDSILVASSANIYGNAHEGVLDEQTQPAPANDYGVSKLAMEYVTRLYADRLPITLVRPFNYTGVGQSTNFLIPKIVDHFQRREATIELGNIDVERDFSDVRTVVDCYARLLENTNAVGKIYNVCSGVALSLNTVIDLIRDLSGQDIEVRVNPAFIRQNEVHSLCGNRNRLESLIGTVQAPPLEQTLRWMLSGGSGDLVD